MRSLPEEVISLIAQQLDTRDLLNLAAVSKACCHATKSALYRTVCLRDTTSAALFRTTIKIRPDLAKTVKNIAYRYPYKHDGIYGDGEEPGFFALLPTLTSLHATTTKKQSAAWEFEVERALEPGNKSGYLSLKSASLTYWSDPTSLDCIEPMPPAVGAFSLLKLASLESLDLDSFELPTAYAFLQSSVLDYLCLDCCNLNCDALTALLNARPTKILRIYNAAYHDYGSDLGSPICVEELIAAIAKSRCATILKGLALEAPDVHDYHSGGDGNLHLHLTSLTNLQHLTLYCNMMEAPRNLADKMETCYIMMGHQAEDTEGAWMEVIHKAVSRAKECPNFKKLYYLMLADEDFIGYDERLLAMATETGVGLQPLHPMDLYKGFPPDAAASLFGFEDAYHK